MSWVVEIVGLWCVSSIWLTLYSLLHVHLPFSTMSLFNVYCPLCLVPLSAYSPVSVFVSFCPYRPLLPGLFMPLLGSVFLSLGLSQSLVVAWLCLHWRSESVHPALAYRYLLSLALAATHPSFSFCVPKSGTIGALRLLRIHYNQLLQGL